MVDVGVILHRGFGREREGDWFLQTVVMVVVVLWPFAVGTFEGRRGPFHCEARRRHGHGGADRREGWMEKLLMDWTRSRVGQSCLRHELIHSRRPNRSVNYC